MNGHTNKQTDISILYRYMNITQYFIYFKSFSVLNLNLETYILFI